MNPVDVGLSWGEVISAVGLMMTIVTVISGFIFAMYRQIRSVKTELDAFKLEVAKNYVGVEQLNQMQQQNIRSEERMIAAINKLGERIDQFMSTFNKQ